MEILALRLKNIRQANKVLQKDIAKYLEIDERTWRYYERGTLEPNAEKLVKIADFFNVSVDYLLGRTDSPDNPNCNSLAPSPASQA